MKIKTIQTALGAAAAALLIGLVGCGGGGGAGGISGTGGGGGSGGGFDGGISGTGVGTMHLAITDAPACGFDHVYITVEKVRVNKSSGAADQDGGWSEIVLPTPEKIDLLTLTNGVTKELGEALVPAGKYTQMRLVLATNGGATPLANSVVPTGGNDEIALTTPSAQQSGLKLNVDMDVTAGQVASFVIDFDACKSVVKRGNSGQYNLKPVINVIPVQSSTGMRVIGFVDPAIALASTAVSVQQGGVPIKATVPDANGKFELYPVPVGNYELVVSAAGRVTAVMTNVPVVLSSATTVNTASFAFSPATSTTATITGTVTPPTATVRALQTLNGGPTVEVAWATVDAGTGAFQSVLPAQAPVTTAYVANATTAYTFTADSAAAGIYTLESSFEGATKTLPVNTAVPSTNTFIFP